MSFAVYWIREQSHTDLMTQGYIGVSGNVEQRFASHRNMERGTNAYLRHAIEKHGWDNMVKSVLLMADKDYCLDIERKLRPADKIGWNLTLGGGYPPVLRGERPELKGRASWNKGKRGIYSAETLALMRQKKLGVAPVNKGVPMLEEHKAKLIGINKGNTYRRGKTMPEHAKEAVRRARTGSVMSAETRKKIGDANRGRKRNPCTEEHKRKLGLLAKGKCWYNNGIENMFCHADKKPDGFVKGRIATWLNKKEK
jgi:hypothetical protein